MERAKFLEMCQQEIDYYIRKGQEEYKKKLKENNMFILIYIANGEDYEEEFDNKREALNRFADICEMPGIEFAHLSDSQENQIAEFKA